MHQYEISSTDTLILRFPYFRMKRNQICTMRSLHSFFCSLSYPKIIYILLF